MEGTAYTWDYTTVQVERATLLLIHRRARNFACGTYGRANRIEVTSGWADVSVAEGWRRRRHVSASYVDERYSRIIPWEGREGGCNREPFGSLYILVSDGRWRAASKKPDVSIDFLWLNSTGRRSILIKKRIRSCQPFRGIHFTLLAVVSVDFGDDVVGIGRNYADGYEEMRVSWPRIWYSDS